jgi:hypothetical protein
MLARKKQNKKTSRSYDRSLQLPTAQLGSNWKMSSAELRALLNNEI